MGQSHLSIAHFSPDAQRILAVSELDAMLRLYAADSGRMLHRSAVAGYTQFARGDFEYAPWSSDEALFGSERGIERLDATTGAVLKQLSDQPAWDLTWSDNRRILIANHPSIESQSSRLTFYRVAQDAALEPTLVLDCAERVDGVALAADGARLAISQYPSNTISVLDLPTRQRLMHVPGPEYARSVAFSPDGSLLAISGNAVWLLDVRAPERVARYSRFDNNVHAVSFSPDGSVIAASAYDGRVRLLAASLESDTLPLIKELRHTGAANVYTVEFSADGSRLLTSSGDRTLRIWGPALRRHRPSK